MEVLGAVSSVAGLISLAIEIPKLINAAASVRAAPDEAKQLSNTVDALVITLQKLELFLKTDEAMDMNLANDSALNMSISACQSRILSLSKRLRSQASPTSEACDNSALKKVKAVMVKFRWPFDKKECLEIISELHAMQSTFEFCLVMENWSVFVLSDLRESFLIWRAMSLL